MARDKKLMVTISGRVADALDRLAGRVDVDRTCTEALEHACRAQQDADRLAGSIDAALARFRAQRAKMESRTKEDAFRAGREFVLRQADYEVATALEAIYKRSLRDDVDDLGAELTSLLGVGNPLPKKLPRGASPAEWFQGFLEGAMDVWLRIRAEVEA